jgi:hypothetical protein
MGRSIGNRIMKILAILAFAASTCTPNPTPPPTPTPTPTPVPTPVHVTDAAPPPKPVPPPPTTASSVTACLNLSVLKCPEWSSTCVADYARLDANKVKLGEQPSNYACVTNASSCAASKACR